MELLLALAVITAVIIFGALISIGNERQRRAIDELREQAVLWAIQDLRIKREQLARDVRVEDPLGWLNKVAANVVGRVLDLKVVETFSDPQVLVCESDSQSAKIFFSPLSPTEIQRMKREQRSRLSKLDDVSPLLYLSRNIRTRELNPLNGGLLFDLEFPIAWAALMGVTPTGNSLWVYFEE